MNKIVYLLLILGAIILSYIFFFQDNSSQEYIYAYPKKGDFEITVTTTGELEAINSIKVLGPTEARRVDIYEMTIAKLIPEGSIVNEGDFVAELDKTPIVSKLNEVKLNVEREKNEYLLAQLDSSQQLSSARDNIENLKYAMEEAKLNRQQSIYEPPSAIRQAEINLEKAERSYNNAIKSYENQLKKSIANLNVAKADLQSEMDKLEKVQTVVEKFTIRAPANGMLIYDRDWDGRKKELNSRIRVWDPVVATLPDLSKMRSKTYVNEVDIQNIKKGQIVEVGLDADSEKQLTGKVESVANIGEQRRGSDAKVFEVLININESDTTLRPAMTTSNNILIDKYEDVLFIPLEGLFVENTEEETINYVYKNGSTGIEKIEVEIGEINSNSVIIKNGLTTEDEILLTEPKDGSKIEIQRLSNQEAS